MVFPVSNHFNRIDIFGKDDHKSKSGKYMVVVLQFLGTSCSRYNNNCITNLRAPDITLSIYTCFIETVLYNSFQCSLHH